MAKRIATSEDLLPRPRKVRGLGGICHPRFFSRITIENGGPARSQGFGLRIERERIAIRLRDRAGERYARAAVEDLIARGPGGIACMEIEDWPDFAVRGVLLDISRDKVPTMATLFELVESLARLRVNQLQLYTEHTFAYRGHERVWRGASPMTGAEVKSLDRFCLDRGIELVPNQNSFGHMERWLKHEPYSAMAEAAGPWTTPWGTVRTAPTTLNPLDRRSLELMRDLYDQLLPNFSSRLFNVGCDETFELGQGRSAGVCQTLGLGRVYLSYLRKLHVEVLRRGRRMMFWSDVVHEHPEVTKKVPKDAIALIWGYEADHPFDRQCRQIKRAGLEFYVCPGTSSWCSFSGRSMNAMGNLLNAARAGKRHGANGYLITDWGDYGHRQYLPASYAGFLYGAAVGWCEEANAGIDVGREVSRYFFGDGESELGPLWFEAGRLHEPSGIKLKNRTVLFNLMQTPLAEIPSIKGLTKIRVRAMRRGIQQMGRAKGTDELRATLAILDHACQRGEMASGRPNRATMRRMAADMRQIMRRHESLWPKRNRPGGLESSLSYFQRCLDEYKLNKGRRS